MKIQGKSISQPNAAKSRQDACKTAWGALKMAPTWPPELPRRLQDGPVSLLDASRTAPGPPKTPSGPPPARLRRPQVAPRASKTAQGASKTPPRALQERFWRSQARPQELSRRGFGDSKPPPRALPRNLPSLQLLPCNLEPLACEWPPRDVRLVNN